jgi:hypothetical protein
MPLLAQQRIAGPGGLTVLGDEVWGRVLDQRVMLAELVGQLQRFALIHSSSRLDDVLVGLKLIVTHQGQPQGREQPGLTGWRGPRAKSYGNLASAEQPPFGARFYVHGHRSSYCLNQVVGEHRSNRGGWTLPRERQQHRPSKAPGGVFVKACVREEPGPGCFDSLGGLLGSLEQHGHVIGR